MSITSLATASLTTAAAAYLDARYHFRKDLISILRLRDGPKRYAAAAARGERSLWYLFEAQTRRIPAEPCIWARETGDLSYARVFAMACQYGNWMKDELGVKPGELVAFYLMNSVEMIVAYLATWAIGASPSMINYNLFGASLLHCLKVGKPRVVLVDEDVVCQKRVEDVKGAVEGELGMRIVALDRAQRVKIARFSEERPGDELRAGVKDSDAVILLFTSGTTGFPKAVKYHISRIWPGMGVGAEYTGAEKGPNGTRFYCCMPIYHGTGFTTTAMAMTGGMCACIGKKFSLGSFWDDIRASKATAFVYVGETARYLLAAPPSPRDKDHNVKLMFGNGLRPDVWNRFRERFGVEMITEFFNSTEGMLALSNSQNRGHFTATAVGHHGLLLRRYLNNYYIPVACSEDNSILRSPSTGFATRQPYSTGGEILVRVPSEEFSGFAGYYDNAKATSQKFVRDVFEKGDLFYRSGDALRRDDDGRWFFLDRLGDTFRWKSENVSTAEVAEVLGRFEGVVESNVYGVLVPSHDGRAGCAAVFLDKKVVEARGGEASFFKLLLRYARQKLPKYAVPVFLRVVDGEVVGPQMHNNKQNKVELRSEGIDLERIRKGPSSTDRLLWATQDMELYEPFGEKEHGTISGGKARL